MREKINFGIIVFVAFISGGLVMYYFNNNSELSTSTNNKGDSCVACADTVIVDEGSLSAAVEKVYDAVVMVRTYKKNAVVSTGSGFVYKEDSNYDYIMTNHHVVDGGDKWTVITSDDTEIEGTVMGSDEYLDLAIIRVKKSSSLSVAVIGDNTKVKLGDKVFTVGSPLGYEYRNTVTSGILSGKDRLVEVAVNSDSEDWVMEVLQIDAAVNPGNSGGPLVNTNGEVIGIISLKLVEDSVENMGFAIPIDYAMSHVDALESGKAIERPLLGISMVNATNTWALYKYGVTLDNSVTSGVVVIEVASNSGASKSGLQKGDVITKINDDNVENSAYLKYLLYKYDVGDTVTLTYYRNGKMNTTKVTLTKSSE